MDLERNGVEAGREVWKARRVREEDTGVCFKEAVMAKGRRRMKAMMAVGLGVWMLSIKVVLWWRCGCLKKGTREGMWLWINDVHLRYRSRSELWPPGWETPPRSLCFGSIRAELSRSCSRA